MIRNVLKIRLVAFEVNMTTLLETRQHSCHLSITQLQRACGEKNCLKTYILSIIFKLSALARLSFISPTLATPPFRDHCVTQVLSQSLVLHAHSLHTQSLWRWKSPQCSSLELHPKAAMGFTSELYGRSSMSRTMHRTFRLWRSSHPSRQGWTYNVVVSSDIRR